uniref:NADH-ubiquinone oxidoreductase chain 1 n=1 Tax=Dactylellina haptotyla TaxID=430498 RepID=A0A481ZLN9_9PEZI|nr:NADH dehydrogenase subunit 1 [Dactylellina haptotyla]QBL01967.1 NADH dehydrogenase subunit 1 [Dactylellina haptotyla]
MEIFENYQLNKIFNLFDNIYNYIPSISPTFFSIIDALLMILPVLIGVAFVTVAERKTLGSMQRRLGPNLVGIWGSLQAFADALKLILKEFIAPTQANLILFFLGPVITLIFSLLGYAVIPFGPGLAVFDFSLGILYLLAVSSVATYGILLAGWSANSKYAFLGSLRSTAQLISYELILSSAILLIILFTGSLNLTVIIEDQIHTWYVIPMIPIFIIFFIGALAETNRAPMDLAEAESELVSGFFTEHSSVPFVSFFLAEYGSILLMSILTSVLFLGGYNFPFNNPVISGLIGGLTLGVKACFIVFCFIWARASMPRIRYDQLMQFCWTVLLPILFAFIFLIPCILYSFDSLAVSF